VAPSCPGISAGTWLRKFRELNSAPFLSYGLTKATARSSTSSRPSMIPRIVRSAATVGWMPTPWCRDRSAKVCGIGPVYVGERYFGQPLPEDRLRRSNVEPVTRIHARRTKPHADVTPCQDFGRAGARAFVPFWSWPVGIGFGRWLASHKNAHGRPDWTEQPLEDAGQLIGTFRPLNSPDSVDSEPISIRSRRLVTGRSPAYAAMQFRRR
jgi:hypothetical protein